MQPDKWKIERERKRNEERKKLLAISDMDAEKLSLSDRYQRIRYLREIDAAKYLEQLNSQYHHSFAEKYTAPKRTELAKVLTFEKKES